MLNLRRWWLSVLLVCWVGCGDDKGTPPDTTAPSAVTDLRVAGTTLDGVTLNWTATGDDAGFGQAARYEARYGAALSTASDWDSATVAPSPPTPKVTGGSEVFAISSMPVGVWRFGVKVFDEVSNASPMSNVVAATVTGDPPPAQVTDLAVVSNEGDSVTMTWTAPGADGNTKTASVYDLRRASTTLSEATWGDAVAILGVPAPRVAGSAETFTISGLESNGTYAFGLKTSDDTPLSSELSNVAVASTGSLVQLTHSSNLSGAFDPAWSPDGRQIAFSADWAGPRGYYELYLALPGIEWVNSLGSDPDGVLVASSVPFSRGGTVGRQDPLPADLEHP